MPVKRHVIFTSSKKLPAGYVLVENPALVERARAAYERLKTLIDMSDDELAAQVRIFGTHALDRPAAAARIALLAQLSRFGPGGAARTVAAYRLRPDQAAGWTAEVLL